MSEAVDDARPSLCTPRHVVQHDDFLLQEPLT
jgi:hypothetical protein